MWPSRVQSGPLHSLQMPAHTDISGRAYEQETHHTFTSVTEAGLHQAVRGWGTACSAHHRGEVVAAYGLDLQLCCQKLATAMPLVPTGFGPVHQGHGCEAGFLTLTRSEPGAIRVTLTSCQVALGAAWHPNPIQRERESEREMNAHEAAWVVRFLCAGGLQECCAPGGRHLPVAA